MKILVFSDSHGDRRTMARILRREQPQHILHLGDVVPDAQALEPFGIPVTYVAGNCDFGAAAPTILTPSFGPVKILMTHGHLYGVKQGYDRILYAGQEAQADILLFGHTHRPLCMTIGDMWVMNPGACGPEGSYGLIQLDGQGGAACLLKPVDEKRSV